MKAAEATYVVNEPRGVKVPVAYRCRREVRLQFVGQNRAIGRKGLGGMANPIVLRRTDSIGAADAENDYLFLSQCFVDSGQIDLLLSVDEPQCVILGRTGSGKTALLLEIKKRAANAIQLAPEALSLDFLINSNVLNFFEEAGVHLDAFYKLLWQHVFCVELIKEKYQIHNEQRQQDFWTKCLEYFARDKNKAKAKEDALRYLEQWGSNFWEETSKRVQEFASKLESELSADANVDLKTIKLGAKGALKLSESERAEVVTHGQRIVNKVQIKELHNLINLLQEDIFDDRGQPFYILIDRLDESWVDDRIRFKLIRALIDAIRNFRQVRNVKVLVALRTDLLFTVLYRDMQPGFQTEKYETLWPQPLSFRSTRLCVRKRTLHRNGRLGWSVRIRQRSNL